MRLQVDEATPDTMAVVAATGDSMGVITLAAVARNELVEPGNPSTSASTRSIVSGVPTMGEPNAEVPQAMAGGTQAEDTDSEVRARGGIDSLARERSDASCEAAAAWAQPVETAVDQAEAASLAERKAKAVSSVSSAEAELVEDEGVLAASTPGVSQRGASQVPTPAEAEGPISPLAWSPNSSLIMRIMTSVEESEVRAALVARESSSPMIPMGEATSPLASESPVTTSCLAGPSLPAEPPSQLAGSPLQWSSRFSQVLPPPHTSAPS